MRSREAFSLFEVTRRAQLEQAGCSQVPGPLLGDPLSWEAWAGRAAVRVGRKRQERLQPLWEPQSCSQGESALEKRSVHTALNGRDPGQSEAALHLHVAPAAP